MVYNIVMKNEKDLRQSLQNLTQEQLIDLYVSLDRRYDSLQANYDQLRRKYYGVKNNDSAVKGQLSLFNEAEETIDDAPAEVLAEPDIDTVIPKKKKRSPKNAKLREVRIETEHIRLEDTHCPKCGKNMEELKPSTIDYLEFHPAEYVLKRYVIHNYTCHKCNDDELGCKVYKGDTSSLPARLIESSIVTPSVIANIAANKFLLGLPFYRQSKDLEYRGISISRQVLCNWFMRVGDDYLKVIKDRMIKDLRSCEILNMDETTLECLEDVKGDSRTKNYTWLAMSGIHEKKQMALYFYNATREHKFVYDILGDSYNGIIQSDGYQAYDEYGPASGHAGCAAHCQRYYTQAAQAYSPLYKTYTKEKDPKIRAELRQKNPSFARIIDILDLFTRIYKVEDKLKEMNADPDAIVRVRKEEARPLWEKIGKAVTDIKANYVLTEKLRKAVVYTENQWEHLLYYLDEWRLTPDNNLAEREGIKPYVMARKNYLFADTRHGAEVSAVYFSLLISARMNNLNPEKYLTYLLEQLSSYGLRDDVIERCLPYSKELPETLKITKNRSS